MADDRSLKTIKMNSERILLCLCHMSGKEQEFIQKAFEGNWVVPLGPDVNGFESDLEKFVNSCAYPGKTPQTLSPLHPVAALSSGTAALHLALVGAGVGAGDEVIVQSFTFCASSNPITYVGASPVFIDSEDSTWNMDPAILEEAILDRIKRNGKKPKAIIPVALYGMPYKIDEILEIARKYDIAVIEDAAEGFGSRFNGRVLGTFGDFGVLSFNGNKMITTSGGGALICKNENEKKEILFYATQAREGYPYYQHEKIGYNYRMSNICAAIGRGQMTIAEEHILHHKHVHALYAELLKDIPGISLHDNPSEKYDSNFWLSTILIDPQLTVKNQDLAYSNRIEGSVGGTAGQTRRARSLHTDCEPNVNVEALRLWLDKANIESRPLWKPMHLQPVYRKSPAYVNGISESIFKKGLCLPSGPHVSDRHVEFVVNTIKSALT